MSFYPDNKRARDNEYHRVWYREAHGAFHLVWHREAHGAFHLLWISTILLIVCLVLVTTRQLGEAYHSPMTLPNYNSPPAWIGTLDGEAVDLFDAPQAPEIKVRVEPDEDLSNFQCREIFPPDPEIQRFREPLGVLPSCFPLPIENNREVGRNVKAHSPKLVGVKERAWSWRTNIKFNQIAEEEHEKDQEMAVFST